jgi:hypothetical protein
MTASGREGRAIPPFIANAPVDDVKAAMVKGGLPPYFVSIPFTVTVVKTRRDHPVRQRTGRAGAAHRGQADDQQ